MRLVEFGVYEEARHIAEVVWAIVAKLDTNDY
jgi:hypothetical protein